jgi:hypothetical protein
MPIANARVNVGSQELDVEDEPPIAESAQSIEKARFRKGMSTGQDGQMLYKMRVQRDTSLDRLARMPAKLQNSRQQTAKQGEVSRNARQVMLWHRRFAIRAQRELRRVVHETGIAAAGESRKVETRNHNCSKELSPQSIGRSQIRRRI